MFKFFKKYCTNILLITIFIMGLSIFLYPYVSDFINQKVQRKEIEKYKGKVREISYDKYDSMINDAQKYNEQLLYKTIEENTQKADERGYYNLLSLDSSGIMGYLVIDKINVKLPIYHGSDTSTLQNGIGHLKGSSLPVGSISSHVVLAGHTGMPSSKLLTDLVKLEVGDKFQIIVLNKTYTYEVDQILVVEPSDTENLNIEENKQYATLITCTPLGVNSHRLLVRGYLIES